MRKTLLYFGLLAPLYGQEPLSLRDAVRVALDHNKSIEAAGAARQAAGARIQQAKSGWLPRLNYSESLTRSDNPVFVFSSLLTQHQFTEQNFALGALNQPNALNNFQSQLNLDQTIYDAGQIRNATRSAHLMESVSGEDGRRTQQDVIAGVVRAYYAVVLSGETLAAAKEAVRSAEADLKRAEAVRAAGMSTDVDVLSIRVHLAAVTEQQISRAADLDVARAALNDVLGEPLETTYALTTTLTQADVGDTSLEQFERQAVEQRPEAREAKLATTLAETQAAAARSSLLPQVGLHAAIEQDRQQFAGRSGGNWLASVSLRWNLFNGFGDKARIDETEAPAAAISGRGGSGRLGHSSGGAPGLGGPARRKPAHRSGAGRGRRGPGEFAHHAEPVYRRSEQRDGPAAQRNRGARSQDALSRGSQRSTRGRRHARKGGRHSFR